MTYVAVDVDGTLVRSNVSFLFGRYLYEKKVLSVWMTCWFLCLYSLHRIGGLSVQRLHKSVFSALFKGRPFSFFDELAKTFFSLQKDLFYSKVLEEVAARKGRGDRVVLLSASPDFLIRYIAKIVSLSEWYGTEYLLDERGNFDSLGRVLNGKEKAKIVENESDQKRIVVMTDSAQDMPLLLLADEVLLVRPGPFLRKWAKKKKWGIFL